MGFLSGFSKVGFVENYGLSYKICTITDRHILVSPRCGRTLFFRHTNTHTIYVVNILLLYLLHDPNVTWNRLNLSHAYSLCFIHTCVTCLSPKIWATWIFQNDILFFENKHQVHMVPHKHFCKSLKL